MKTTTHFAALVVILPSALFAVAESYNNANLLPLPPVGHGELQNEESQRQDYADYYYGYYGSCCLRKPCLYELSDDEFEDDANYPGKDEGNLIDYFSR